MSNTWWFSCNLDGVFVSHIRKSQTTPTILHNEECYPPSYDILDCCARGGQIRMWHVAVRWRPTYIVGRILQWKRILATFYLSTCDHFRDMTQPILAFTLGFHWQMTHVEFARDVCPLTQHWTIKSSSHNTTLGGRESMIPEPRSTPSLTPISTILILWSWFATANLLKRLILESIS